MDVADRMLIATQTWLLGMPIFQFFLLITPDKITVVCSQKKADIIETLKQGDKQITLDVIRRGKVAEENVPLYKGIIDQLRNVRRAHGSLGCTTNITGRNVLVSFQRTNSRAKIWTSGTRPAPNTTRSTRR